MGAKPSITTEATWIARNTTASSERLRCSIVVVNRGQRSLHHRTRVRIPSNTLAVRSTRLTIPALRATYHAHADAFAPSTRVIGPG